MTRATDTPGDRTRARAVLRHLRGNRAPYLRPLRSASRRIIAAGERADPADLAILAAEEMATRPPNRWDCPGIACIGDEVIWDGEAEHLGIKPMTKGPRLWALRAEYDRALDALCGAISAEAKERAGAAWTGALGEQVMEITVALFGHIGEQRSIAMDIASREEFTKRTGRGAAAPEPAAGAQPPVKRKGRQKPA